MNAEAGETPGPLGLNDGASRIVLGRGPLPARMLASLVMGAKPTRRIRVISGFEFTLPDPAEAVFENRGEVLGGGSFELHADSVDEMRRVQPKEPEVTVTFNKSQYLYEITSITVFTLKIVNNPDARALPRAGENVTNDRSLKIRTPPSDPLGSGYWRDVIENMKKYESQSLTNLQWYAPGSTEYHEEMHNQQFRKFVKQNARTILRQIENEAEQTIEGIDIRDLNVQRVEKAVRKAVRSVIVKGTGDEDAAYRGTFAALWKPEIEKIRKYAKEHDWD